MPTGSAPRVVLLPGDGIGPGGGEQARLVLELLAPDVELEEQLLGAAAIRATGKPLPEETLDACRRAERRAQGPDRRSGVRGRRRSSGAGAARVARRARRLRKPATCDRRGRRRADRARARRRPLLRRARRARGRHGLRHVRVPPEPGRADRAARVRARGVARRSSHVGRQGERARHFTTVAPRRRRGRTRDHPDVRVEHMLVDNAAMQLASAPEQFDVLVTENMFGDILSDLAAAVTGGLGARAVGEPLRRRPGHLRAGARLGARHRPNGHGEPGGDAPLDGVAARARARAAGAGGCSVACGRRGARRKADRRIWAAARRRRSSAPPCASSSPPHSSPEPDVSPARSSCRG